MKLVPLAALLLAACAATPAPTMKLTPILTVETIEPCLPLWEQLGFVRTAEVPTDDGLGFVMLARDGAEVMYQTHASVAEDLPQIAAASRGSKVFLFLEVEDLAALDLTGVDVAVPERETFYGKREVGVRDAAGNVVILAMDVAPPE